MPAAATAVTSSAWRLRAQVRDDSRRGARALLSGGDRRPLGVEGRPGERRGSRFAQQGATVSGTPNTVRYGRGGSRHACAQQAGDPRRPCRNRHTYHRAVSRRLSRVRRLRCVWARNWQPVSVAAYSRPSRGGTHGIRRLAQGGSALADPAEAGLGRALRGQVLAVTPGAARAVVVLVLPACGADHELIVAQPARWCTSSANREPA